MQKEYLVSYYEVTVLNEQENKKSRRFTYSYNNIKIIYPLPGK
jgi:hypothetical protein